MRTMNAEDSTSTSTSTSYSIADARAYAETHGLDSVQTYWHAVDAGADDSTLNVLWAETPQSDTFDPSAEEDPTPNNADGYAVMNAYDRHKAQRQYVRATYRLANECRLMSDTVAEGVLRVLTWDDCSSAVIDWQGDSDLGESVYLLDVSAFPALVSRLHGAHRVAVLLDSRNFLSYWADSDERTIGAVYSELCERFTPEPDGYICTDCALWVANGDLSALDLDDADDAETYARVTTADPDTIWTVGNDEAGFSWAWCDRCHSHLGGDRHSAYIID